MIIKGEVLFEEIKIFCWSLKKMLSTMRHLNIQTINLNLIGADGIMLESDL